MDAAPPAFDLAPDALRHSMQRLVGPHGLTSLLMLADCREAMPTLPDGVAGMVLCDLPYGTTNCRWDSPLPLDLLWKEYGRLCNGAVALFAQLPFDKVLGCSNLKQLRYEWIWHKTHPTGHLNAKRNPMKAHENVLIFSAAAAPYYPIHTHGHQRKTATKRGDKTPVYGEQRFEAVSYDSTSRYPRDVLTFPSDKQRSKLHPTQKPLALCEYLIQTHSIPGQTVLDNCMGSGTSGVAALRNGRNFIGIESDPKHFQTALDRIRSEVESASAMRPNDQAQGPAAQNKP